MPADKQWYTCTYLGQSLCFRLRNAQGNVVHPVTFLDGVVHALQRYADTEADHGDEAGSNNSSANAALSAALRTMAQQVYGGVRVEVSLRDDLAEMLGELAIEAEEVDEDDVPSIEDWWSPLYLALCARHVEALVHLLRFHADYAAAVVDLLLHDYTQAQTQAQQQQQQAGAGKAATHHDCAATTWTVVPKEAATAQQQQLQHQQQEGTATTPASGGNEWAVAVPLLRCVLCRSWGGALVLLRRGPHVSTSIAPTPTASNAHMCEDNTNSNAATTTTATAPAYRRHVSGLDPLPEQTAAQRRQQEEADTRELARLLEDEAESDEDEEGDEKRPLRLNSVLTALEPFVQCVLYELEHKAATQAAHEEEEGDDNNNSSDDDVIYDLAQHCLRKAFTLSEESRLQHGPVPALYIQADVLYSRCHASLDLLSDLLHACYGTLSPILHGRSITHTIAGNAWAGSAVAATASTGSSARQRSCSRCNTPIHSGMHSRTTSNAVTRSSLAMVLGGAAAAAASGSGAVEGQGKESALRPLSVASMTAAGLPPGVTASAEPFWLECAPQDAQRVAFYATWIEQRDHAQEPFGPARMRRAKMFIQECHGTLHTLKRLCEAHAVPPRCMWSGVMLLSCKLLAPSCTVEDFVDGMGTDSVAYWTLPLQCDHITTSNSASSRYSSGGTLPGAMTVLLAAGAMATHVLAPDMARRKTTSTRVPHSASAVASALRLLECKVATILAGERGTSNPTTTTSINTGSVAVTVSNMAGSTVSTTVQGGGEGGSSAAAAAAAAMAAAHVPRIASPLREYLVSAPSNHAERFADLWLGLPCACHRANSNNGDGAVEWEGAPTLRKFDTRVELLYYAVLERVLQAAERRWAEDTTCDETATHDDSLFTALRGWVSMWEHFVDTLRDTIVRNTSSAGGEHHNESEATIVEGGGEGGAEVVAPVTTSGNSNNNTSAEAQHMRAGSTTSVVSTHAAPPQPQLEPVEVVERLLGRLREQLRGGRSPLPALYTALFSTEDTTPTAQAEGGQGNSSSSCNTAEPSLEERFNVARTAFANIAAAQGNETKLQFYALYKQATTGDVTGSQPWRIDVVAHAKWAAWKKLQGMSSVAAKEAYVAAYEALQARLKAAQT